MIFFTDIVFSGIVVSPSVPRSWSPILTWDNLIQFQIKLILNSFNNRDVSWWMHSARLNDAVSIANDIFPYLEATRAPPHMTLLRRVVAEVGNEMGKSESRFSL